MRIALDLPEDLVKALGVDARNIDRTVLEAIAIETYREGRITAFQLRQVLGIRSRFELDSFLKQRQVWLDYSLEDVSKDREAHRRLGI